MARYYGQSEELKCFDYNLYTYTEIDGQCIAPTMKSKRCRWTITAADLKDVKDLKLEAQNLYDGRKRNRILRKYVLLRCCNNCHRDKLKSNENCLDQVMQVYGELIGTRISSFKQNDQTNKAQQSAQKSNPKAPSTAAENRVTKARTIPDNLVPYLNQPKEQIRDTLLSTVPSKYAKSGQVYGFTCPSRQRFIKIGYTSKSAESRVLEWQDCNPGATLLMSTSFEFPERMERLIHLQMTKQRYKINICKNCMKTHFEWFKISPEDFTQIINDWKKLVDREPLYDSYGILTTKWRARAHKIGEQVTAKALLDLLDAEEKPSSTKVEISKPMVVSLPIQVKPIVSKGYHDEILAIFQDFMLMLAEDKNVKMAGDRTLQNDKPFWSLASAAGATPIRATVPA